MSRVVLILALGLLALALLRGHAAATAPPVVAIDALEAPDVALSPTTRRSLSLFLRARLAEVPGLRVIPAPQVRAALVRLRRAAVAGCPPGQSCALELGRQLAANRVLAPRILRAGEGCVVTLTLFDVRSAAAELAATARGSCGEGALAATLSAAIDELSGKLRAGPASGPATTEPAATPASTVADQVSVYVSSAPPGMPLKVDGEGRGKTPARLDLVRGKRYRVAIVGTWPFEKATRTIVAARWQELHVKLRHQPIDRMELATTTEWFAFGFGGGTLRAGDRGVLAATLRVVTLRWRYLFWTAGEILAGFALGSGPSHHMASFGTRAGLPLYLGRRGKHQLLAGLGLSYMTMAFDEQDKRAFGLVPGIEYVYLATNGAFQAGAAVHALLPAASDLGERWPYQILFTLRAGISISPMLRAERRGKLR